MVLMTVTHTFRYQDWRFELAGNLVLGAFLALVSIALFAYLLRLGAIAAGRLYVSVSLYFLMAMGWFVVYKFIDRMQPGSFAEQNAVLSGGVEPSKLLYFSLTTLATLGYGGVVAVRPAERMFATLEAAAGVLYIAIFVASLVASYQSTEHKAV
jgi:Ion channel